MPATAASGHRARRWRNGRSTSTPSAAIFMSCLQARCWRPRDVRHPGEPRHQDDGDHDDDDLKPAHAHIEAVGAEQVETA